MEGCRRDCAMVATIAWPAAPHAMVDGMQRNSSGRRWMRERRWFIGLDVGGETEKEKEKQPVAKGIVSFSFPRGQ